MRKGKAGSRALVMAAGALALIYATAVTTAPVVAKKIIAYFI